MKTRTRPHLALLATGILLAGPRAAGGQTASNSSWNAAAAEHLFNRAAFGACASELERAVAEGRAKTVQALLDAVPRETFYCEPIERPGRVELAAMGEAERRRAQAEVRRQDRELTAAFASWWIAGMLDGPDPLRERMTLFWSGHFTSSLRDVRDARAMIEQNEFLRAHAFSSFRELVRGIVRDPAMLEYLDNNQNRKGSPNENFARELMELFTLGEGNYGEEDVKEAARALTGWVSRRGDDPRFLPRQHDRGPKTILGRTENFDADGLIDLLLEQPACSRWIAGKLLAYFEGHAPADARLQEYARFLASHDYRIRDFLEKLFLDPQFYSASVVGERIASPIDFLVGSARRLGVEPPPAVVWIAAGQLGERLLDPPNVKGWEGGRAWITTATFLQRGNFAGMMLGVVKLEDVLAEDAALGAPDPDDGAMTPGAGMDQSGMDEEGPVSGDGPPDARAGPGRARARGPLQSPEAPGANARAGERRRRPELTGEMGRVRALLASGWRPNIHLVDRCQRAGVAGDAQVVDLLGSQLLAVALSEEGRATLLEFLQRERAALDLPEGAWREREHAVVGEQLLRRLAHLILSLPEAQLH